MARVGYIPHDQDREDIRAEDRAERRAMKREPFTPEDNSLAAFGGLDPSDEEYSSVEAFVEFLIDNDREDFNHLELSCLNRQLGVPHHELRKLLVGYGFHQKIREREHTPRGFSSWDHNLYAGNPMCGGSGLN